MTSIFTKIKPFIFILIAIFITHQARSQDDCSSILENAELLFDQGIIEDIPSLLVDCLEDGFTPQEKKRAQKLLILSYLFDNRVQEAEDVMMNFLKENPEYEIQPGDPPEFTTLFAEFRTYPFLSAGVFFGGNLTSAAKLQQYGPFNTNTDKGEFYITSPDIQIGAALHIFLTESIELNIESIYTRYNFAYRNLQYGFAEVSMTEKHQRLEFPVSATYDLVDLSDTWIPYFRMGASYGMILEASTDYTRSHINTGEEVFSPVEAKEVYIDGKRNSNVFSAILGGGIKYKIPRGYFFLDLRYSYGLSELVNPETRWDQDTVFRFYYADSDFHLDHFSFSIGYRYSFFKSTKL